MSKAWMPSFFSTITSREEEKFKKSSCEDVMSSLLSRIDELLTPSSITEQVQIEDLYIQFNDCMQQLRDLAVQKKNEAAAQAYLDKYREVNGKAFDNIVGGLKYDPIYLVNNLNIKQRQFAEHLSLHARAQTITSPMA